MKKILLTLAVLLLAIGTNYAQSFKERLGSTLKNAAETIIQTVQNSQNTEQEEALAPEETSAPEETAPAQPQIKPTGMAKYNKFDFVAGDEIIFEDLQAGEQLGEFPSMWDLLDGEAEIAQINGENVIALFDESAIVPLMKEQYDFLGNVFTIEYDCYFPACPDYPVYNKYGTTILKINNNEDTEGYGTSIFSIDFPNRILTEDNQISHTDFKYDWRKTNETSAEGSTELVLEPNSWHHISISFNKRAIKTYIDETRIANIPNVVNNCGWIVLRQVYSDHDFPAYYKNFRIAKGAVPLYDRVMSEGRFITYGIWFEVGKSEIKPESMGEINRIYKMLTDNPTLSFTVEGHTDATGDASSNLALSKARAKAIVDKLVEMGISPSRLKSEGKGQTNPINDNSTTEGRAKNRRVEFVKF